MEKILLSVNKLGRVTVITGLHIEPGAIYEYDPVSEYPPMFFDSKSKIYVKDGRVVVVSDQKVFSFPV